MRPLFTTTIAVALASQLVQAQDRFQQEAYLIFKGIIAKQVWISKSDDKSVTYYGTFKAVDSETLALADLDTVWLVEPTEYSKAMELFQGRKYEEAQQAFADVRKKFKPLASLPDNHSSLAAFYELESLRKLNKIGKLAETLKLRTCHFRNQ